MTVFWFIFTFGYIIPFLIVAADVCHAVYVGRKQIPGRTVITDWNDLMIGLFFVFTPIINTLASAVIVFEYFEHAKWARTNIFKDKS